jgi:signal transduction histidine kinase
MAASGSALSFRAPAEKLWLLLLLSTSVLGVGLFLNGTSLVRELQHNWAELLFWALLIAIVNLLPVSVQDLYLTLDTPIVLAVALLYPPEVGAFVALIATIDIREFRRSVPLATAWFNRVQTSLAVFLAATVFAAVGGIRATWWVAILGTVAALAVDYLLNVGFIVAYQVRLGLAVDTALSKLKVGNATHFLALYLSYGALALILAILFVRVGAWSVIALLIPIFAARQALMRGQELQLLTRRLQARERLMEQLLDRMIDERRDERLRIAAELHDSLLQQLTKIWMLGQFMGKEMEDQAALTRDISELVGLANESIEKLRELMSEMHDSPLGSGGLLPSLNSLVRDLRLNWGVRIELEAPSTLGSRIREDSQVGIYQIAREALLNAAKHSHASLIRVRVSFSKGAQVIVEDNGRGFDPESRDGTRHFGIGLMHERARRAGGTLTIESSPEGGTRVLASLPVLLDAEDHGPPPGEGP